MNRNATALGARSVNFENDPVEYIASILAESSSRPSTSTKWIDNWSSAGTSSVRKSK
jgi:hypothetical protein